MIPCVNLRSQISILTTDEVLWELVEIKLSTVSAVILSIITQFLASYLYSRDLGTVMGCNVGVSKSYSRAGGTGRATA